MALSWLQAVSELRTAGEFSGAIPRKGTQALTELQGLAKQIGWVPAVSKKGPRSAEGCFGAKIKVRGRCVNPETKRPRRVPGATLLAKPCEGVGRIRSQQTGRCYKPRVPKPCAEGSVRNADTGRCRKLKAAVAKKAKAAVTVAIQDVAAATGVSQDAAAQALIEVAKAPVEEAASAAGVAPEDLTHEVATRVIEEGGTADEQLDAILEEMGEPPVGSGLGRRMRRR